MKKGMPVSTDAQTSLKERLLDFAFQQGVSTVLLLLVFGAMWQGIPMLIDRVESRMEYINDSHERRLSMVIEQHSQDRQMFQVEQKRLQEVVDALLAKIVRDREVGRP